MITAAVFDKSLNLFTSHQIVGECLGHLQIALQEGLRGMVEASDEKTDTSSPWEEKNPLRKQCLQNKQASSLDSVSEEVAEGARNSKKDSHCSK